MNFLAHLYLSQNKEGLLMGNFLSDMVKNRHLSTLPESWVSGVKHHRWIDTYTDQHEKVRKCTMLLRTSQSKYAPVVLDVVFDFLLSKNWHRITSIPFSEFENDVYSIIRHNLPLCPLPFRKRAHLMTEHRFLHKYTNKIGLKEVLLRLHKRASFPNKMDRGFDDFEIHENSLENYFMEFYPELITVSDQWIYTNLQNEKKE